MGFEEGTSNGDNIDFAEGVRCLKSETLSNGIGNVLEQGSGETDGLRTYKRRKNVRLSSETKAEDGCRTYFEAASNPVDQVVNKPCGVVLGNASCRRLHHNVDVSSNSLSRHWKNVQKKTYPSVYDILIQKDSYHNHKDAHECSSQTGWISDGSQNLSNGHASHKRGRSLKESKLHNITEMCQHAFRNILISEELSLLSKLLYESFHGTKADSVVDFSHITSKMKEGAYEQSPALFLSDIQQIWRMLQESGARIVSLAKSLSDLSRRSYCEQVGDPLHIPHEEERQEYCAQESDSRTKTDQIEDYNLYKICSCKCCGGKANGKECLVCDSCEEMYHVSCIEPVVKEIPHRSWYCANCTADGIGSPHKNCVVCERLNVPRTLNHGIDDQNLPANEAMHNELEENSNSCAYSRLKESREVKNMFVCKICGNEVGGEEFRVCGHAFCPNKCYHIRCLTNQQLKLYGPKWYCPSCLCRGCLTDRDDDKIVLCDGCDHAYHNYCMDPPLASIPKGKWFCRKCFAGIQAIRKVKRAYQSLENKQKNMVQEARIYKVDKKWNSKRGHELEKGGGMDMLLNAAKTLEF